MGGDSTWRRLSLDGGLHCADHDDRAQAAASIPDVAAFVEQARDGTSLEGSWLLLTACRAWSRPATRARGAARATSPLVGAGRTAPRRRRRRKVLAAHMDAARPPDADCQRTRPPSRRRLRSTGGSASSPARRKLPNWTPRSKTTCQWRVPRSTCISWWKTNCCRLRCSSCPGTPPARCRCARPEPAGGRDTQPRTRLLPFAAALKARPARPPTVRRRAASAKASRRDEC